MAASHTFDKATGVAALCANKHALLASRRSTDEGTCVFWMARLRARQHAQATAAASSTARNCTISSLPLPSSEGNTKLHKGPSPTQSSSSKRASRLFRVVAALVKGSSKISSEPLPTKARHAPRTVVLEVDALQALPSGSALLHVPSSVAARAAADADANHARPRESVAAAENADLECVGARALLSNMADSEASRWNSGARKVTTCTSTLSIACTSPSEAAAAASSSSLRFLLPDIFRECPAVASAA